MTELAHAQAGESNRAPYKSHADFSWRGLFEKIFPDNRAASVASFTQTSVGAAEHVLRGRNGPSGPAIINLLRSPIGQRVLDAICAGVEWRDAERRLIDIQIRKAEIEKIEQEIRALDRAASPRR